MTSEPPVDDTMAAESFETTAIAELGRGGLGLERESAPETWRTRTWALFRRDHTMQAGAILTAFLILLAVLAPVISPHDPLGQDLTARLLGPSRAHLLGTDDLGRDQLSRLLYGARVSLFVGLIAVAISSLLGSLLGLISGYFGGLVDNVIMRLMDAMLAFPAILLALLIVSALGPGLVNTLIALGVSGIPHYARLIRSTVLTVRSREYVLAARALGAGSGRIMFRHVLPNSLAPVLVATTLQTGTVIVGIASLGYLGLGVQPPTPEWGSMLSGSRLLFFQAPWLLFAPGVAILLAVVGFNLIGDGLRDALDPRLRQML